MRTTEPVIPGQASLFLTSQSESNESETQSGTQGLLVLRHRTIDYTKGLLLRWHRCRAKKMAVRYYESTWSQDCSNPTWHLKTKIREGKLGTFSSIVLPFQVGVAFDMHLQLHENSFCLHYPGNSHDIFSHSVHTFNVVRRALISVEAPSSTATAASKSTTTAITSTTTWRTANSLTCKLASELGCA